MTHPPNEQDIFQRIVMGMPAPKRVASAMVSKPPAGSVSRRWGTIDAITGSTVSVNVGGIIVPGVRRVATYAPTVGETVMLDVVGGDMVVVNTLAPSPKNDLGQVASGMNALDVRANQILMSHRAQFQLTGGGVKTVNSDLSLKWTQRFIAISMGKGNRYNKEGYFNIDMPPDGTVIPNPTGGPTKTVTGGRVPIHTWGSLWYEPNIGPTSTAAADPSRFRLIQYDQVADYDIPDHWILVAVHNFDDKSAAIKWGDGTQSDYWRIPPVYNGWAWYGAPFGMIAYCKIDNIVWMQGLMRNGTAPHVATLPEGYRPESDLIFPMVRNVNTIGRINIRRDGQIILENYDPLWCSMQAQFPAWY